MSEPLTDEQLADWDRETHDGDHPRSSMLWRVHALIQEVRRLREESESRHKAQQEFQRVAEDYAESNRQNRERAEKAEAEIRRLSFKADPVPWRDRTLKAEADRDRYKAVVDAARELYLVMKSHHETTEWMLKWQYREREFLKALAALDQQENNPNK